MDANVNNCSCELCQPNWYLGRDEEFVALQPQVAPEKIERDHIAKLEAAGLLTADARN